MLEVRKEKFELSNGKSVGIITKQTKSDALKKFECALVDETDNILTPFVKSITFDKENEIFLFQDKLAITEYLTGSVVFYVDYKGNPIGLAFFDMIDGYFDLGFKDSETFKERYPGLKTTLSFKFREEIYKRTETKIDNCKKLALAYKEV